jgi:hypothetical protein
MLTCKITGVVAGGDSPTTVVSILLPVPTDCGSRGFPQPQHNGSPIPYVIVHNHRTIIRYTSYVV